MPSFLTPLFCSSLKVRLFTALCCFAVLLVGCASENFATVSIGDDLLVLDNPRVSLQKYPSKDLVIFANSDNERLTLFAFELPKKRAALSAIGPEEKVSGTYVHGPLIKTQRSDGVWVENTFAETSVLAHGELHIEEDEKGRSQATFWATICPKRGDCDAPMSANGTFVF